VTSTNDDRPSLSSLLVIASAAVALLPFASLAQAARKGSQAATEVLADFDWARRSRAAGPEEPPALPPTPLMLPSASSPVSLLMPLRARLLYTQDWEL